MLRGYKLLVRTSGADDFAVTQSDGIADPATIFDADDSTIAFPNIRAYWGADASAFVLAKPRTDHGADTATHAGPIACSKSRTHARAFP